MSKTAPSLAWRDEIFNSPPRIDVERYGKSTTRHPVDVAWSGTRSYAHGGHERIAHLLLEHLWTEGLVLRWKSQPLNLLEIGGPNLVPDVLVELASRELHIVEVKAKRFLDERTLAKFELERSFLEPRGFGFHVWTNNDVLSPKTSHTVAELERGRRYSAPPEVIDSIKAASVNAKDLGELLSQFGWDDVLSAAAHAAIHFDITRPVHEQTPLFRDHSDLRYAYLFAGRNAPQDWWEKLDPAV